MGSDIFKEEPPRYVIYSPPPPLHFAQAPPSPLHFAQAPPYSLPPSPLHFAQAPASLTLSPSPNTNEDVIYVLRLCDGKYYVGRTNNISRRLEEHKNGKGSEWTKFYPPSGPNPMELHPCLSSADEDYRVKMMIMKYGIENVRGGSYCNVVLTQQQIASLNLEMNTSKDLCFNCKKPGHYANKCPLKINSNVVVKSEVIPTTCAKCGKLGHREFECKSRRDIRLNCTKCGRDGHNSQMCYAKTKQP